MALSPFLVKRESGKASWGTHRERRHARLGSRHVRLARAGSRDVGKATSNQAEKRIGGERLCVRWEPQLTWPPRMNTPPCSHERSIVAWRCTKKPSGARGDDWVSSLSGNCCLPVPTNAMRPMTTEARPEYRAFGVGAAATLDVEVPRRFDRGRGAIAVAIINSIGV